MPERKKERKKKKTEREKEKEKKERRKKETAFFAIFLHLCPLLLDLAPSKRVR